MMATSPTKLSDADRRRKNYQRDIAVADRERQRRLRIEEQFGHQVDAMTEPEKLDLLLERYPSDWLEFMGSNMTRHALCELLQERQESEEYGKTL